MVYCISGHLLEGVLRGSAPACTCLDCASPMSALAACSVFAFRVMHAVLPMHMDVRHVLPARDLPFTLLCPCQVFVGAFEQLFVREYKEKLTQASSLGKHLWSQYLRAGKGYVQIHIPFPPSSDRAQCLSCWEGVCSSHRIVFVHSFLFSVSVSCCSLAAVALRVLTGASWAGILLP